MLSNKDIRVEGGNLIINGEKHPLDPAVDALTKRANIVQGKFSALDAKLDAIEALEKTASGNPISLTGVAAAYAMSNIMTIEPIQSGSGDPSPTNVRPISGLTEGKVVACGKNLFDKTNYLDKTYIDTTTGELVVEQNAGWITTPLINISGVSSLTMQGNKVLSQGAVRYRVLDFDKNIISVVSLTQLEIRETNTFTNLNGFYFQMCFRNEYGALDACQIEEGSVATEYEPYTGATASITFGQTVYGGSVNFKTGEVTVTHANIASYNGESINEPWLSSLDKYESGATPTTGAQVVYPLSTPITLTLTPAELELLKGNNTISGNGANISIDYIGR